MSAPGATLRRGVLFTFSLPAIMQGFMHAPAAALIQGIYAKHAGLTVAAIGVAVMLVRVFDALIDPVIGYLSDRTHHPRWGRKPWLVGGTLVAAMGLWFLFTPPADVTVAYFTAWFLVACLGWSLIEIPYRAWSLELSSDYVQRTRVQTWVGTLLVLGTLLFYLIPLAAKGLGFSDTSEFNLETLALGAVVIVVALPLLNLVALWRVAPGAPPPPRAHESWRDAWHSIVRNGPLLRFIAVFVAISVAGGIASGVTYLYIDAHLGLAQQLAALLVASVPAMLIGIPFWGWLCTRHERHRVWAGSLAVLGACYMLFGFLPRGEASLVPAAVLYLVMLFNLAAALVAAPAMVGDIADYGRLQFGQDRGGTYFAFYTLVLNTLNGLGSGFGLVLVGWFGFDAAASEQTPMGTLGIRVAAAWLPAAALLLTVPVIWRFPLNRARHAEIVAEFEAREAQATAVA